MSCSLQLAALRAAEKDSHRGSQLQDARFEHSVPSTQGVLSCDGQLQQGVRNSTLRGREPAQLHSNAEQLLDATPVAPQVSCLCDLHTELCEASRLADCQSASQAAHQGDGAAAVILRVCIQRRVDLARQPPWLRVEVEVPPGGRHSCYCTRWHSAERLGFLTGVYSCLLTQRPGKGGKVECCGRSAQLPSP